MSLYKTHVSTHKNGLGLVNGKYYSTEQEIDPEFMVNVTGAQVVHTGNAVDQVELKPRFAVLRSLQCSTILWPNNSGYSNLYLCPPKFA